MFLCAEEVREGRGPPRIHSIYCREDVRRPETPRPAVENKGFAVENKKSPGGMQYPAEGSQYAAEKKKTMRGDNYIPRGVEDYELLLYILVLRGVEHFELFITLFRCPLP